MSPLNVLDRYTLHKLYSYNIRTYTGFVKVISVNYLTNGKVLKGTEGSYKTRNGTEWNQSGGTNYKISFKIQLCNDYH